MGNLIVALIIQLVVISPMIILSYKRDRHQKVYLLLFALYLIFYQSLIALPNWFPALRIVESSYHWNWSGKIYAIVGSLVFYILFRKKLVNHDYITVKQNRGFRPQFFIISMIFLVTLGLALISIKGSPERLEYFLFQYTMPGLDEEIAFRGIMLGLLANALNPKMQIGSVNLGNPSLIITSTLFGLVHSISIDSHGMIHQHWFEFMNTFFIGLLLGWMTIKSGSILMAVMTHSVINTLPKILVWI